MLVDESHDIEAEDKPHTTTFVAYWLDVRTYESWAASSSVQHFWTNLADDAGVWREIMTAPTSRYMYAANQDLRWGLTSLIDNLRASDDEGYLGVYRHRIGSKDDTFTSPYVTASKLKNALNSRILNIPGNSSRNSNDIRLGRVRVDGVPNNICFVGQQSKLNNLDAAETDQLAYFLDLAHFEASERAFKGHVQLRKTVMELYGPGGPMEDIGKAELYVELLILKSNEFQAEYIGCLEGNGLMYLQNVEQQ